MFFVSICAFTVLYVSPRSILLCSYLSSKHELGGQKGNPQHLSFDLASWEFYYLGLFF